MNENEINPKSLDNGDFQNDNSETANEEPNDYLYFNVMPKDKRQGPVVAPVVTTEQPETQKNPEGILARLRAYEKLAMIVGAVIVLAVGGYFAYAKFFSKPAPSEDIVVKTPTPHEATSTVSSVLPTDWKNKYFASCNDDAVCGPNADPDHDGLINLDEYKLGADPNNSDSDNDGLADGDEVHVFGSDPLNSHTGSNLKYSDSDNLKGGYNIKIQGTKYTQTELDDLLVKMKGLTLHQPTVTTLGDALLNIYHFTPDSIPGGSTASSSQATATPASATTTLDNNPQAKQDRDAQRSNTVKDVGIALIKYFGAKKIYPQTNNFAAVVEQAKIFSKVGINPVDPVNIDPFIYTYQPGADGNDYTLSFYSETLNQVIKKHAADGQKDLSTQEAGINDQQRMTDLKMLQTALLLYSTNNAAGNQDNVFPTLDKYKTALLSAGYISNIPKDPKTEADYEYAVSANFNTFTLKATLDAPPTGTTGYLCNQDECRYY